MLQRSAPIKTGFKYLIAGLIIAAVCLSFTGYYPGGSPGGYSGSPADGKNCTYCHSGSAVTVSGILSSDIDSSGYIPGVKYSITVSVPGTGLKGFEVSPLDAQLHAAGILIAGTDNRLVNSGKSVTQSVTAGSNPAKWTFSWTAPPKGTGRVTFYGAFVSGKPNTMLSSMEVKEKFSSSVQENNPNGIIITYNPAVHRLSIQSEQELPCLLSGIIYTSDLKKVLVLPQKEISKGASYMDADVSSLKRPAVYFLQYFTGNSSAMQKIYLY
jgi:hypothetical protein